MNKMHKLMYKGEVMFLGQSTDFISGATKQMHMKFNIGCWH